MIKVVNREDVDVNLFYKGQPLGVKAKSDVIVSEAQAEFLVGTCGFLRKEEVKPLEKAGIEDIVEKKGGAKKDSK